ncbi:MAG: hypothetical protein IKW80_00890 [Thermoguttaceae bacterium]|nr:hypothetical protein [Thermoguttaceae bacterium]
MTPIEELIKIAQNMETVLEEDYGATGKGLHEKASSVESQLSPEAMKKIRFIATIRNKAVHDDLETAEREIENVRTAAETVYQEFRKHNPRRRMNSGEPLLIKIIKAILKLLLSKGKNRVSSY